MMDYQTYNTTQAETREAIAVMHHASELDLAGALDRQCARLAAKNIRVVGTVDDSEYPGRGSDGMYYCI